MLHTLFRPSDGTTSLGSVTPSRAPLGGTSCDVTRLLRRSTPLRCMLISCLAMGIGALLGWVLLPVPAGSGSAGILVAHLPAADTPPALCWLKLIAARFPFWLLLAVAGFTRFSGGLTSAVLLYRGVCDGAALGFLGAMAAEGTTALSGGFPLRRLLTAFAVWAVTDLAIRLFMTLSARSMAGIQWESSDSGGRMAPAVRLSLLRYLALCLGGLCAGLAACGVYTGLLYV